MIFRKPVDEINVTFTVEYFKQAYLDTLQILTTYKGYFYVLPIQEIAIEDPENHSQFINMFLWRFISGAFNYEFTNKQDFNNKFNSFEEIEAGLNTDIRDYFVFNELSDRNLLLRERVEKYCDQITNISSEVTIESDAKKFLIAVSRLS
jgi:hypothetical protein